MILKESKASFTWQSNGSHVYIKNGKYSAARARTYLPSNSSLASRRIAHFQKRFPKTGYKFSVRAACAPSSTPSSWVCRRRCRRTQAGF
mmetsp:Transcript_247/g.942  ORF Transcript_247/g.942 Transcript_247/m.942 type:complete len:89 (+) Transcript_247:2492-2758(+)